MVHFFFKTHSEKNRIELADIEEKNVEFIELKHY